MKSLYISVVGGGSCTAAEATLAEQVGRLVARESATLVCGGLGGVMEAAARGARAEGGTTIGILPGHDRSLANAYIEHAVTTGMGHARNLAVVSSGDAIIAVGGSYGTLSEIGLAAKLGRPVVILGGWRLGRRGLEGECLDHTDGGGNNGSGIFYASSAQEAIDLVKKALASSGDGVSGER